MMGMGNGLRIELIGEWFLDNVKARKSIEIPIISDYNLMLFIPNYTIINRQAWLSIWLQTSAGEGSGFYNKSNVGTVVSEGEIATIIRDSERNAWVMGGLSFRILSVSGGDTLNGCILYVGNYYDEQNQDPCFSGSFKLYGARI